jgi:uncharacterized membrane protein YkvI
LKVLFVALAIITGIVGIGFASGAELTAFFGAYNSPIDILKVVFFFVLMVVPIVLLLISAKKGSSFKNKHVAVVYNVLSLIIFIITAGTMLTGAFSVFGDAAFIAKPLFCFLLFLVGLGLSALGQKFFKKALSVLGIFLTISVLVCLILALTIITPTKTLPIENKNQPLVYLNLIFYALTQIHFLGSIIAHAGKDLKNKKQMIISSFIGVGVLSAILILGMFVYSKFGNLDMLFLSALSGHKALFICYQVVLFIAATASLLSGLFIIKQRFNSTFNDILTIAQIRKQTKIKMEKLAEIEQKNSALQIKNSKKKKKIEIKAISLNAVIKIDEDAINGNREENNNDENNQITNREMKQLKKIKAPSRFSIWFRKVRAKWQFRFKKLRKKLTDGEVIYDNYTKKQKLIKTLIYFAILSACYALSFMSFNSIIVVFLPIKGVMGLIYVTLILFFSSNENGGKKQKENDKSTDNEIKQTDNSEVK